MILPWRREKKKDRGILWKFVDLPWKTSRREMYDISMALNDEGKYWLSRLDDPVFAKSDELQLSEKNPWSRDQDVKFIESTHTYYVLGEKQNCSVTKMIHDCFPEFDPEAQALKMVQRSNFWTAKRYEKYHNRICKNDPIEVQVLDVLKIWDEVRDEASRLGTQMHLDIEMFWNRCNPMITDSREWQFFCEWAKEQIKKGLRPFRTEVIVYARDLKAVGTVDMLFKDSKGRYHLRDWKRSKKISKWGFGKVGKGRLNHMPDCNYSHYCLQLNVYRHMLENYYDVPISTMAIVVFHPLAEGPQEISVPRMEYETKVVFEDHLERQKEEREEEEDKKCAKDS